MRNVPGVLSDPAPEALIAGFNDADPSAFTIRILWWTRSPRQHEMLSSYDAVLTAISRALAKHGGNEVRPIGRTA